MDVFLESQYGFSLNKFSNDLNTLINDFYTFVYNIPGVSTIKDFEDYLNCTGKYSRSVDVVYSDFHYALGDALVVFGFLCVVFTLVIVCFLAIDKFLDTEKKVFFLFKAISESENNLSNLIDIKRLSLLFVVILELMLAFFLQGYIFLDTFYVFSIFLTLNVLSILGYFYFYNINIYVYVKGLLSKLSLALNTIGDNITLSIFISRLVLQFSRLFVCFFIFFLFQEMSSLIMCELLDYYFYLTLNGNSHTAQKAVNFLIEYLDMIMNFSSQYSIYIVSVMWLIPFLFTFIKKVYKAMR